MKKRGRPAKTDATENQSEKIIEATIRLLSREGASAVTIRNVCTEADISNGTFYHYFRNKDDLLMYFVKDTLFGSFALSTPYSDIAGRIIELYLHLLHKYQSMGKDFMKHFYSTENHALSAYMNTPGGKFASGTIMERSEIEMLEAQRLGFIQADCDVHQLCADICTIVKGCIFEWCLEDGQMDADASMRRIITSCIRPYLTEQAMS